ncbi:MAG: thrombospondin type 3 repeat-containing protein, partial [Nannocystaceae bacterium]|nr:thrombospondin type 3 repeat-containing protein [Nannocystaceae bacterium]
LSTKIDRYGTDTSGTPRSPNPETTQPEGTPYANAITCADADDAGLVIDRYARCSDFISSVDRGDEEQRWEYLWCRPDTAGPDCPLEVQAFRVPLFDKLRETHPDLRPAGMENHTSKCRDSDECGTVHSLPGTDCIGTHVDTGAACLAEAYEDGACEAAVCRAEWVVDCVRDEITTGADTGYCVDRRFDASGGSACMTATSAVENEAVYGGVGPRGAGLSDCSADGDGCAQRGAGSKLAFTDWNENRNLTAQEACQGSLYGPSRAGEDGFACDPYYQSNLAPLPLYERDRNLPSHARRCICPNSGSVEFNRDALEADGCVQAVQRGCYDTQGALVEGRAGRYAVKFASPGPGTRPGGIVYDPALKGFDWRPADVGGVPRADVEECAEGARQLGTLNRHDGWRARDNNAVESFEDFDRAMCSGQTYDIVFNPQNTADNPSHIVDKAGNTLVGKSVYTFETAQFHVVPESGSPKDSLRIGACDDFALRFSNKYDASPENLSKLQLYRVTCIGEGQQRVCELAGPDAKCDAETPAAGACCELTPVAGGPACAESKAELEAARKAGDMCLAPCLMVDVANQEIGQVAVQVDPVEFGRYLEKNQTYRMLAPMAGTLAQAFDDPDVYSSVFWDACGMPLVAERAEQYDYDFRIDEPKCKEDQDRDGVPLSCDNDGDELFSPNQDDLDYDQDGFGLNDLCPVVAGPSDDTADSDNDGVGNECDSCRNATNIYNANAMAASVPDYLRVRNVPDQTDTDHDGIGDACDNCVVTANCGDYGQDNPHEVGDPLPQSSDLCQTVLEGSMVGEACEGESVTAFAAGPVGLEAQDDFDQDGLVNILDYCPRQPLSEEPIACETGTEATDCGPDRRCSLAGFCNHLDSDGDGVGDRCDTCAFDPNPTQAMDGGSQDDDPDGDFVGEVCELGAEKGCGDRKNARPFGFHGVTAGGNCCTTQLIEADAAAADASAERGGTLALGDLLLAATCLDTEDLTSCTPLTGIPFDDQGQLFEAADGLPLLDLPVRTRENCTEEQQEALLCFSLPATLENTPGVLKAPPGCDAALADAGMTALENLSRPLTNLDFAAETSPLDALWQNMCFLPQTDQDYDGIGDPCDKCRFAFDPSDRPYRDAGGVLAPAFGAACNGALRPDEVCELRETLEGEEGEDAADTDDMGGSTGGGTSGE